MSEARVIECSVKAIFEDPAIGALLAEYERECLIPDAEPQKAMYAAMEQAGVLQCFGAYVAGELVGFASVLSSVMPHHGKRVATIESLFASAAYRASGAGNALLAAARQHAYASGCVAILHTARVGSALETVLSRRVGCWRTHTVFSEWLS